MLGEQERGGEGQGRPPAMTSNSFCSSRSLTPGSGSGTCARDERARAAASRIYGFIYRQRSSASARATTCQIMPLLTICRPGASSAPALASPMSAPVRPAPLLPSQAASQHAAPSCGLWFSSPAAAEAGRSKILLSCAGRTPLQKLSGRSEQQQHVTIARHHHHVSLYVSHDMSRLAPAL